MLYLLFNCETSFNIRLRNHFPRRAPSGWFCAAGKTKKLMENSESVSWKRTKRASCTIRLTRLKRFSPLTEWAARGTKYLADSFLSFAAHLKIIFLVGMKGKHQQIFHFNKLTEAKGVGGLCSIQAGKIVFFFIIYSRLLAAELFSFFFVSCPEGKFFVWKLCKFFLPLLMFFFLSPTAPRLRKVFCVFSLAAPKRRK